MGNCIQLPEKKRGIRVREMIKFEEGFDHYKYINFKMDSDIIKEYTIESFGVLYYVYEKITYSILRRFTLRHKWNYLYRVELLDDLFLYYDTTGEEILHYERNLKKRRDIH
jgi:hypothetical protein